MNKESGNKKFRKTDRSRDNKNNPTDFNIKSNSVFPGFKETPLENCTKIDDVKSYKDKYKQK
jgi:hypothetical protein